jgi:pimeloyl-ACP methyl ester carboxylesterase
MQECGSVYYTYMKPLNLVEITTKDKLVHQGIFFRPSPEASDGKSSHNSETSDGKPAGKAILWVHGLSGKFYGDVAMVDAFIEICEKKGWAFASFNNRGHDLIASIHKADATQPSGFSYMYGGAGYELFEDCIYDIHAGVDFLVTQGFSEVIVVGHSTGALKVCYSEGNSPHKNIVGVVLAGALSDRLGPDVDKIGLPVAIQRMEQLIADGKGDDLVTGLSFFPMTPKRFVSLYKKGSAEDVMDYDADAPSMKAFSAIKKPMLVIISQNDEYLDRPAEKVKRVFDSAAKSSTYTCVIVPDATHGFDGKEKEVSDLITSWIFGI